MKEGFYLVHFSGSAGKGFGIMVLDTNIIVGVDCVEIKYDGTYIFNKEINEIEAKVKADASEAIEGSTLVTGIPAQDFSFNFCFPKKTKGTSFNFQIPGGAVSAEIKFVRDFHTT